MPRADQGRISDMHWCDTMFVHWLGYKNNKIMSYFPGFFGHFVSLAFVENGATNLTSKRSKRVFFKSIFQRYKN